MTKDEFARLDKLSAVWAVAMEDTGKVRAGQTFKGISVQLDMGRWLEVVGRNHGVCVACMAGAVMLNTLGVGKSLRYIFEMAPHSWDEPIANRLRAINRLRRGEVDKAYFAMFGTMGGWPERFKFLCWEELDFPKLREGNPEACDRLHKKLLAYGL